jgi:hypothetical protein
MHSVEQEAEAPTSAEFSCTCPRNEDWQCIGGLVYGPCGDENCYGVCISEGLCRCRTEVHADGCHEDAA